MRILQAALSIVVLALVVSLLIEAIPSIFKLLIIAVIIGLVLTIARTFGIV